MKREGRGEELVKSENVGNERAGEGSECIVCTHGFLVLEEQSCGVPPKKHRSTDAQVFERGMHDPIRDEAFSGGNESCNVKRNHFLLGKRKEKMKRQLAFHFG